MIVMTLRMIVEIMVSRTDIRPSKTCEKPLQMRIHKKPSDYKLPESKIKMIYHHETASTTWHLMDKGGLPKATLQTMSPYRSNAVVSNLQQEETFYPLEW